MKRISVIFLAALFFVVFAAVLAGCVSQTSSSQVQVPTSSQTTLLPTQAVSATPTTKQSEEITAVPASTDQDTDFKSAPDPYVEKGAINRGLLNIPNCEMAQLLPDVVNDPDYGLNSYKQNKLAFMSAGDFNKVLREYNENKGTVSTCFGVTETPYWDFIILKPTLLARNARPTTYNITLVVKFRGAEGPKYTTQMNLTPKQVYPLTIYIPIKSNQISDFADFNMKFDQII